METLLEPCWNLGETLLGPRWNLAGKGIGTLLHLLEPGERLPERGETLPEPRWTPGAGTSGWNILLRDRFRFSFCIVSCFA